MKGFTLFLSILAIVAAGVSGLLYLKVEDRKAELTESLDLATRQLSETKQRVEELTRDRESLDGRIKSYEADLNEIKARNTTLEARNGQLSRDITQVREQLGARSASDQTSTAQLAELNRQLVEAKAAAATSSGGATAEQVAAYEARIANLEGQLASSRRAADALNSQDPLATVPVNLTATVIDVGARAAFVALDAGSRKGAVPELEMIIRRGAVVVARVRLTTVNETYSIASILPRSGSGNVRPGDTATRN